MLTVFRTILRAGLIAACLLADVRAQNEAASRRGAIEGMYPVMLGALQAKNFGRARNICEQAILWEPQNAVHHYNLACIEAQAGGSRVPYAWGALELAIALGFNDANHLQSDPDLAPLRHEPRFADLVRKVIYNTSAAAAVASITFPAPAGKSSKIVASPHGNGSSRPDARAGEGPGGLFLMTRFVASDQPVERSVWYFSPDRQVYRGLVEGCAKVDLAAHAGLAGTVTSLAPEFEIRWSDGSKSADELERDGEEFTWDMGLFVPVIAFEDGSDLAGIYDGAEPVTSGGHDMPVAQHLTFNADGTFRWEGVSFSKSNLGRTDVSAIFGTTTTGRWKLSGLSLALTSSDNVVLRRIAFPLDEEKTIVRPDRIYFGGLVYKRRP